MVERQDPSGAWVRGAYRGVPHSYYARAAYPLLELAEACGEPRFAEAAHKHLAWVLEQLDSDAYPRLAAFAPGERSFTHTIAYVIEGLLEAGALSSQPRYFAAARRMARAVLDDWHAHGVVAGDYGPGWAGDYAYTSPPANAQLALCCFRLARLDDASEFAQAGRELLAWNTRALVVSGSKPALHGALRASFPSSGPYLPLFFPLWGAKFMLDALLASQAEC